MSQLMKQLMSTYMAPAGREEGGGGDMTEAEKAAARGDALDESEEDAGGDKKDDGEEDDKDDGVERDEKGRFKSKAEEKDGEEEEVDAKDDGEEEDLDIGKGKKAPPSTIPKARFDELNTKSRKTIEALQKTIEEMQKGVQKKTEEQESTDIKAAIAKAEEELEQLQADGKNKEAVAKLREIRELGETLVTKRAEGFAKQASSVAVEQMRFDMLVDELEAKFPQLNPDSAEYDEGQVEEVQFLRTSFEKNGLSSSKALARAVEYVLVNKVADEDDSGKGKDEDKDDKKDGLRDKGSDRKQKAVERNLKDAKRIPARADGGKGLDSDKKGGRGLIGNIKDLTEAEFEKLGEDDKARARGDFVE
jgi:hypothetical protein